MRTLARAGLVAAAAALAAAALLLVLGRPRDAGPDALSSLPEVDAAIAGGYLSTARESLESIRAFPSSEPDQMRLLKRAFQLGDASGDYSLLAALSRRAMDAGGRSARIKAVAAYAELRVGRLSAAERILSGRQPAGSSTDRLRGEALMRRGAQWKGSDDLTRVLLALETESDPRAFSVAALRTGEKRLSLDAALLAMRQGDPQAAAGLARESLGDARFDEPAAEMLYDAGAYEDACARLLRLNAAHPGIGAVQLLLADAYEARGMHAEAEMWLQEALPRAPSLSWTPYADLALFALGRGDTARATRRIDDGLAFFARSRELRIIQALVDVRAGQAPRAAETLAGLVAERPDDGEAGLLLLSLQAPQLTPEGYRARMWKLFDRVPADARVFASLASVLVASRDWEGTEIALRQHRAAGGEIDARGALLQGLALAMRGNDADAAVVLRASAQHSRDGIARFDLALVLLRLGRAAAALTELDTAEGELRRQGGTGADARLLSRIEMLRGSAHLQNGDARRARAALQRSIALDRRSLRAGLLLRKLDAGGQ